MNEKQFAKLVEQRPDLAKHFHYVSPGKDGRIGFYRRIPITYKNRRARPATLLRSQIAFGEAGHSVYGKRGLSEEGTPHVVPAIRKALTGKKFRKGKVELAIEKLTKTMEKAAEIAVEG
ncbi:hypothetical protein ES702_00394 [subsurface metagenome]